MNSELRARFPEAAYIDPTARVYGGWKSARGQPVALCRDPCGGLHVRIGRCTNVQDHVMVHVGYRTPTVVGDYCSITHRVVLHGCIIGTTA